MKYTFKNDGVNAIFLLLGTLEAKSLVVEINKMLADQGITLDVYHEQRGIRIQFKNNSAAVVAVMGYLSNDVLSNVDAEFKQLVINTLSRVQPGLPFTPSEDEQGDIIPAEEPRINIPEPFEAAIAETMETATDAPKSSKKGK